MLTENRKYNFIGELDLKRSKLLGEQSRPKDDKVNWFFAEIGTKHYSFVYKIECPQDAKYLDPFNAFLAFTMFDLIKDIVRIGGVYPVFRGEERIGILKITSQLSEEFL